MGNSRCEVSLQATLPADVSHEVSHDDIARRAYELWEARGCPAGDGNQDWDAAIAELTSSRNGAGGIRHWWERLRRSIVGRDS